KCEVVEILEIDEQLHRPDAMGAIANHCRRHEVPADDAGHHVRGELAPVQRIARKIPQRCFSAYRFVDRQTDLAVAFQLYGEGVVRAPRNEFAGAYAGRAEEVEDTFRWPSGRQPRGGHIFPEVALAAAHA